ncbi:hypothetical protein RFI_12352, partial [Reticulomyxa filosa]
FFFFLGKKKKKKKKKMCDPERLKRQNQLLQSRLKGDHKDKDKDKDSKGTCSIDPDTKANNEVDTETAIVERAMEQNERTMTSNRRQLFECNVDLARYWMIRDHWSTAWSYYQKALQFQSSAEESKTVVKKENENDNHNENENEHSSWDRSHEPQSSMSNKYDVSTVKHELDFAQYMCDTLDLKKWADNQCLSNVDGNLNPNPNPTLNPNPKFDPIQCDTTNVEPLPQPQSQSHWTESSMAQRFFVKCEAMLLNAETTVPAFKCALDECLHCFTTGGVIDYKSNKKDMRRTEQYQRVEQRDVKNAGGNGEFDVDIDGDDQQEEMKSDKKIIDEMFFDEMYFTVWNTRIKELLANVRHSRHGLCSNDNGNDNGEKYMTRMQDQLTVGDIVVQMVIPNFCQSRSSSSFFDCIVAPLPELWARSEYPSSLLDRLNEFLDQCVFGVGDWSAIDPSQHIFPHRILLSVRAVYYHIFGSIVTTMCKNKQTDAQVVVTTLAYFQKYSNVCQVMDISFAKTALHKIVENNKVQMETENKHKLTNETTITLNPRDPRCAPFVTCNGQKHAIVEILTQLHSNRELVGCDKVQMGIEYCTDVFMEYLWHNNRRYLVCKEILTQFPTDKLSISPESKHNAAVALACSAMYESNSNNEYKLLTHMLGLVQNKSSVRNLVSHHIYKYIHINIYLFIEPLRLNDSPFDLQSSNNRLNVKYLTHFETLVCGDWYEKWKHQLSQVRDEKTLAKQQLTASQSSLPFDPILTQRLDDVKKCVAMAQFLYHWCRYIHVLFVDTKATPNNTIPVCLFVLFVF